MWAHYADNHSGFVLEFDAEAVQKAFEEIWIKDVEYKDAPDGRLAEYLHRVAATKKPRHAVWLRQAVLYQAYFSKQTAWSYEQECRLVDFYQYVEDVSGNNILFVPIYCITAIFVGHNFPKTKLEVSQEVAQLGGFDWYQSTIGSAQVVPFFRSQDGDVYQFDGSGISETNNLCAVCSEPILEDNELCPWCSVTEAHKDEAARGNPFRILDHYGLLEGYFEEVGRIEGRRK